MAPATPRVREFPRPGTVYHYFRAWKDAGVLAELQRALHEQARLSRGRLPCPSVVILDSQSVKNTERGGTRGFDFDGHKRVKGRKRHLLVDTLGMVVARRVEAANVSGRRVGARLGLLLETAMQRENRYAQPYSDDCLIRPRALIDSIDDCVRPAGCGSHG